MLTVCLYLSSALTNGRWLVDYGDDQTVMRHEWDLPWVGINRRIPVGALELTRVGQLVAVDSFRLVEMLTVVAIIYFILA